MFAPIDGEVIEVLVDHNSVVKKGDPLVKLRNRQMEIEITDLEGQRFTTLGRIGSRVKGLQARA